MKSILICGPESGEDMWYFSSVIKNLRDIFPSTKITWLLDNKCSSIANQCNPDEILSTSFQKLFYASYNERKLLIAKLQKSNPAPFDQVFVLHESFLTSYLLKKLGPVTQITSTPHFLSKFAIKTIRVPNTSDTKTKYETWLAQLAKRQIQLDFNPNHFLQSHDLSLPTKYICFYPGLNDSSDSFYRDLAKNLLQSTFLSVVFVGMPDQREHCDNLSHSIVSDILNEEQVILELRKRVIDTIGKVNFYSIGSILKTSVMLVTSEPNILPLANATDCRILQVTSQTSIEESLAQITSIMRESNEKPKRNEQNPV